MNHQQTSGGALRVRQQLLRWQGPAGALEVLYAEPVGVLRGLVVVCHPHPLYGGTMHNKVVTTLAQAFDRSGYATVRFNFRGVGESAGKHDGGLGEFADLMAVIEATCAMKPDVPWLLSGFSFGAYVACCVAQARVPAQLFLVAPPVSRLTLPEPMPASVPCPTVVVQGLADEVIPAADVMAWANGVQGPCDLVTFVDTSHFFHGQLVALRSAVEGRVL